MGVTRKQLANLSYAYARMERRYNVSMGSLALAEAVSFRQNQSMPVHRWFPFKEGFSAGILSATQINAKRCLNSGFALLDPFCGSGTTLLAAELQHQWATPRIGIEVNPFLVFVAKTKLGWRNYSPTSAVALARRLTVSPLETDISRSQWPELSSLRRSELISPRRVSAIIDLSQRISSISTPEAPLLLLALASIIEPLSYFRKDGRALRIIRDDHEIKRRRTLLVGPLFRDTVEMFAGDIERVMHSNIKEHLPAKVVHGDARDARTHADLGSVGLAFYSPPYLNHIDYTEVYKVESSLLGFVRSGDDRLAQRKRTIRSHGSVGLGHLEFSPPKTMTSAFETAAELISGTGWSWHSNARRLVLAYCADIHASLKAQYDLLRPGGLSVCVVGNSAHGCKDHRIPLATDLFIASLGESAGFDVERIIVARQLSRRNQHHLLRESIVVLRK